MTDNHRGFTLLELLLALSLLLLLAGLAAASIGKAVAASAVRQSRADGLAAIHRARQTAIALGAPSSLTLEPEGWTIRATISSGDSTLIRMAGPDRHDVTVDGMNTPLAFGAAGIATGFANRTIVFRRSGLALPVVISRLGRIR